MDKKFSVTGSTLKIIAVVSMLIDHVAAVLLNGMLAYQPSWGFVNAGNREIWSTVYLVMRGVGRLAFPIYCFLLVEGFVHTRSRIKYGARLLAFAFISEIPFDLAFRGALFDSSYNNVFFTLFGGLIVMELTEIILSHMDQVSDSVIFTIAWFLLKVLIVSAVTGAVGYIAENILNTDYGFAGIAAITIMYVLRREKEIEMLAGVLMLTTASFLEAFAVADVLLVRFYNGERGKQMKYFFYLFYPIHLLILGLLGYFLGIV